jgi:hypothetical protein
MVASSADPAVALTEQPPSARLADTPTTTASTAHYLESGERTRRLMRLAFTLCVAVLVVVALAWMLGVLPGAVKLF